MGSVGSVYEGLGDETAATEHIFQRRRDHVLPVGQFELFLDTSRDLQEL